MQCFTATLIKHTACINNELLEQNKPVVPFDPVGDKVEGTSCLILGYGIRYIVG